jgi:hypothetical protein
LAGILRKARAARSSLEAEVAIDQRKGQALRGCMNVCKIWLKLQSSGVRGSVRRVCIVTCCCNWQTKGQKIGSEQDPVFQSFHRVGMRAEVVHRWTCRFSAGILAYHISLTRSASSLCCWRKFAFGKRGKNKGPNEEVGRLLLLLLPHIVSVLTTAGTSASGEILPARESPRTATMLWCGGIQRTGTVPAAQHSGSRLRRGFLPFVMSQSVIVGLTRPGLISTINSNKHMVRPELQPRLQTINLAGNL